MNKKSIEQKVLRGITFKLVMVWLAILLLGSFWLTAKEISSPLSMAVVPEAPREGEPIVATFKLSNPSPHPLVARYQFYVNGCLVQEKATNIAARTSKTYQYAYENTLPLGQQLNFAVKTQSELGNYQMVVSSPQYPPQLWSSFASFASFSTSLMSSMSTMTYYQSTFESNIGLNVGIIVTLVLITLYIFLELTQPIVTMETTAFYGRLRIKYSTVTWILFIIFMGIVYTRVTMILAT